MNKTLKSLAATTALAIAAVGAPAFADEATQAKADTPDKPVVTTEAPKTETAQSSDAAKPALDAQSQVVSDAKTQVATAQDTANQADEAVTTAQANVDTAKAAVKDVATTADQATNLSEQKANETETKAVNDKIADQTATAATAKPAVDTAQSEKDAADADVATKEATVQSAQAAVDGTGKTETPTASTDDKATKAKELDLLKTILATSNDIMLNEIQTSDEQVYFLGMPTEEQSKKLHQALDDYSKLTGKTELAING
ncbi:hypothetical protein NXS10_08100, partial [Streptococcus sp. SQ9-PEA]|nr:hypothetical protein [Streptococcus sciuri]